ncbi:PH-domain-containing protein [Phanerochaete sordida]|uniref:PH-domain-containing protein n=1 Tax=Phanerochaete sordida TaxID=48140 RepID=A0A9P3LHY2_9APHY|nr:PH-domain-containing protein [Phanerochaete sordida]
MSSATSSRSVPPPSHQEIARKLSVHSIAKPNIKKPSNPVSGTESDSDSVFSPETISPSTHSSTALFATGGLSHPPLQSIAERRTGSGEESEEDEEDEEGGWHVETREQSLARGSDETILKTGYLWKKGERRKTWKKRWFVLRPAHLAFYKTSAEYKLLRLLDLSEIHSCTPVQLKKHNNTFCMISPTRTFYLQAESAEAVTGWVKAITDARQALLATSTPNTATTAPIPIPRSASQGHRSQAASPTMSHSHSPYNHHLTSSESEDNSPSKPRAYSTVNAVPSGSTTTTADATSPLRQPGPIDPSKLILSGYLMKCGSRRHVWHNRWFVLSGDRLVYSRSHMDTKPHRSIPLAQILDALEYDLPAGRHHPGSQAVSPPHPSHGGEEHDGAAGKHTFKIVTTKRTLLLCAPSEEEEIKWLSAVRALIARRSVVPGDSAAAPGAVPPTAPAGSAGPASASARTAALAIPSTPTAPASLDAQAAHLTAHAHHASASGGGSSVNSGTLGSSITSTSTLATTATAVSGAGGGAPPTHRRKDSFARRLSLSSAGGILGTSLHSPSAAAGVPQEA